MTPPKNPSEFTERLASSREAAGLRTADVGAHVGRSRVTVEWWEYGRTEPSREMLLKLAALYGVSPGWLAFGEERSAAE